MATKTKTKKAAAPARTLSAEGRARIVAAQKKRWKAYHASKKASGRKKTA